VKDTKYNKIYIDLLNEIKTGVYKPGDQLPTELEISERYNVSRITSKKAIELLSQDGLVTRIPGKGTFVSSVSSPILKEPDKKEPNLIGIVMNNFSSDFGTEFLRGVQDEYARNGGITAISCVYTTQEGETREITRLIENGVKGIIIMPLHGISYNPSILISVLNDFPLVLADRYLTGLNPPFVGSKNFKSSVEAVNYLFSLGHKNIAFISSVVSTTALSERLDGYIRAYAHSNYPLNKRFIKTDIYSTMPGMNDEKTEQRDIEGLLKFFRENDDVTAVLAADFHIATLIHKQLDLLGKRIPQDISLICFDRMEGARMDYTFIRQQQYEMGVCAAQLLKKRIDGDKTPQQILLDCELVPGDSVLPIKTIK
jgi:DNA-binding LacI/PurR family transcriptional regulator